MRIELYQKDYHYDSLKTTARMQPSVQTPSSSAATPDAPDTPKRDPNSGNHSSIFC